MLVQVEGMEHDTGSKQHCGDPSVASVCNWRWLFVHQKSFWGNSFLSFLFFFKHDNWQLLIRSQAGAWIDLKICRSDYETGRWEALKLKPAQMESDACSANRHQPTSGCLKAFDLWELDWYGNCCLTDTQKVCMSMSMNTHKHRFVSPVNMKTDKNMKRMCISNVHSSTNSVSVSMVRVATSNLLSKQHEPQWVGTNWAFQLSSTKGRQTGRKVAAGCLRWLIPIDELNSHQFHSREQGPALSPTCCTAAWTRLPLHSLS